MGLFGKKCACTSEGVLDALLNGYDLKEADKNCRFMHFDSVIIRDLTYGLNHLRSATGVKSAYDLSEKQFIKVQDEIKSAFWAMDMAFWNAEAAGSPEEKETVTKILKSHYVFKIFYKLGFYADCAESCLYCALMKTLGIAEENYNVNYNDAQNLIEAAEKFNASPECIARYKAFVLKKSGAKNACADSSHPDSGEKSAAPTSAAGQKTVDTSSGKGLSEDKPTQNATAKKSTRTNKVTTCEDSKKSFPMPADEAFEIAEAFYSQKKYEESIRYYQIAAQQGHARARNCLGCLYRYGEGVQKDIKKALNYFETALAGGNAKAGANIGMIYYTGDDEEESDFEKAFPYLLQAAKEGVSYVMPALSDLYYQGAGCEDNEKLAAYFAYQAIEQDEQDGYYMLGICFDEGIFFPECTAVAKYCFERAAENDYDVEEYLESELYQEIEAVEPDIVPFNDNDPDFFTQECPYKQYMNALYLLNGKDADDHPIPVDPAGGQRLLEQAAKQGYAEAQYSLGTRYLNTNEGDGIRYGEDGSVISLGCDTAKALYYLDLAARQGHPEALDALIDLYGIGEIEIEQDIEKSNEYQAIKYKLFQDEDDNPDEDLDDECEDDEDECEDEEYEEDDECEDEWESFDTVEELYIKYKNPEEFDDPRDQDIINGCKYMQPFYIQVKKYFDETAYFEANTFICEMLCIDRSEFIDHMCEKFNFMEDVDFEKWLWEAMEYASNVFAQTEDTAGIDTPIALLNLGYYLYRRTMPYNEDWLMPYISCLYYSGVYDEGLGMGVLLTARYYVYQTEACEIDTEEADPVLSFWEETYGEALNAVLEKNGTLYCDGYLYTPVED